MTARMRWYSFSMATVAVLIVACLAGEAEIRAAQKERGRNGRLEISTNPGGYPILIDDKPDGETSSTVRLIDLSPGTHRVEVLFPNGMRWARDFNIRPGRRECIALTYTPRIVEIPRRAKSPCPYPVNVSAPATVNDGDIITFAADVNYEGESKLNYNWTVLPAGTRIISGAGTPTITVDSTDLGRRRITAVVAVDDGSGAPNCRRESQASTAVLAPAAPPVAPRRFDEFPSVTFDDDKARLDNLAIALQNNPGSVGYIIVYGGRASRPGYADLLGARARNYLTATRGIDDNRLRIVNGGYRAYASYELWVVPHGAPPPTPTPTIGRDNDAVGPPTTARPRRVRRRG